MYSSRVSLNDCINLNPTPESEYCIIEVEGNIAGEQLAKEGGFLTHEIGEFYRCKTIVAKNLNLKIISYIPLTIK